MKADRALLAPVAAFAALALVRLGAWPLSADEARHAHTVAGSLGDVLSWVRSDNHPPLYFLMLKGWSAIAGSGEAALRLLSIPFAAAALAMFGAWVRDAFSRETAVRACWVIATSPFFLFQARLAKNYALLQFLSVAVLCGAWWLARGEARRGALAWWGCAALALLWTHYLSVPILAAAGGWALVQGRAGRRVLGALALAGIGFAPWLPIAASRVLSAEQKGPAVERVEAPAVRRLAVQAGYTGYAMALGQTLEPSHVALAGMGGLAAVLLGAAGIRAAARSEAGRFALVCAVVPAALGALMMWVFLRHPDLSVAERIGFAFPWVALAGVLGWESLGNRVQRWVSAGCLSAAWAISVFNMYAVREHASWDYLIPWRDIAAQVAAAQAPVAVLHDSRHFGALGWYYLRPHTAMFLETRALDEAGALDSAASEFAGARTVFFLRSTRDADPGRSTTRAEEILSARFGPPERRGFVQDSEGMRRLKEWLRRGTGVATERHKVELLQWSR